MSNRSIKKKMIPGNLFCKPDKILTCMDPVKDLQLFHLGVICLSQVNRQKLKLNNLSDGCNDHSRTTNYKINYNL